MDFGPIIDSLLLKINTDIDFKNEAHLSELILILKEEYKWDDSKIKKLITNLLLTELKFADNAGLAAYEKKYKIRDSTKITIGNKETTPGEVHGKKQDKTIIKKDKEEKMKQVDNKETRYIPNEKELKAINKTLTSVYDKLTGNDKKIMGSFIKDIQKLVKTNDPKLVQQMVKKYKLGTNKDPHGGETTKLYIRVLEDYTAISGRAGNVTTTKLGKFINDLGGNLPYPPFGKKTITPDALFEKQKKEFPVKKIKNGIMVGQHKIEKRKPYPKSTIKELIAGGLNKEEAIKKYSEMQKWVEKENYIMDNFISSISKGDKINMINICDACDVSTPKGRINTISVTANKLAEKLKKDGANVMTKDIQDTINDLNKLSKIKNKNEMTNAIDAIMYKIGTDVSMKTSAPDIAEILDFMKVLGNGGAASLPADTTFPLGDILVLPGPQPTAQDFLNEGSGVRIVSLQDRSVKKDKGGASAALSKIQLTKFKPPETKDDLLAIVANYDELMNNGEYKTADKLIKTFEKKYKHILEADEGYQKRMKNRETWMEGKSFHDREAWKRYYQLGYMMGSIYNNSIDFQAFVNSRYYIGKNGVRHEITDGITTQSMMGFDPSQKDSKTNKSTNTYAGHLDYEEV